MSRFSVIDIETANPGVTSKCKFGVAMYIRRDEVTLSLINNRYKPISLLKEEIESFYVTHSTNLNHIERS